ncbi:MAG: ATP-binding cassette domain-containing protein [Ruminococcus sp.]
MDKTIIRLDNIAKSFGNVRVIHHISFSIEAGKVYALAGENGAGKSTLCNIISGSLKPDEGTISYGDKEYSSFTIQQAKEIGIKMVHRAADSSINECRRKYFYWRRKLQTRFCK